jgi:hypothetical protein
VGAGEVIEIQGNKITFNFEHAGFKILDTAIVSLERVERSGAVPFRVNMERLKRLCTRFHADMQHNRAGCNDGSMALKVLADVERYGEPTATNRNRLLNWRYTDGAVFQEGVQTAREICIAIHGRLLPDPDTSKSNR